MQAAAATPAPTPSSAPAAIQKTFDRPSVVRSVPTLGDLNINAATASTNIVLAVITLVILILTAAVFNQTVEENERRIHSILASVAAPFAAVARVADKLTGGDAISYGGLRTLLGPIIGLVVVAAVYGLEEPGAGFNDRSLVLFLSYFGAFALATFAFEGVQWIFTRRYGARGIIRVFPIGVFVAILAVTLTRITGFQPGLMYGFVAANAIVSDTTLTREQQGKQTLYPALALLGCCLLAWVLADPLRAYAEDHPDWWNAVPEGIAVGLFVSGLEGLFFQLIPIQFMDGRKLFDWNKVIWLVLSLASGFLFWQVLINDDKDSIDAAGATSTIVALIVVIGCLAATIAMWLFFRALGPEKQPEPVRIDPS